VSATIDFNQFILSPILPDSVVIFGGTFDPIHQGHIQVIMQLLEKFETVVIAPTTQNPWKQEKATDLELRIAMIQLALRYEHINVTENIGASGAYITTTPYTFAVEVLALLRHQTSAPLFWAVAEDAKDSVASWKDWSEKGVTTIVLPITIDIHATRVRKGLETPHPALTNFIAKHQLYKRA